MIFSSFLRSSTQSLFLHEQQFCVEKLVTIRHTADSSVRLIFSSFFFKFVDFFFFATSLKSKVKEGTLDYGVSLESDNTDISKSSGDILSGL